MDFGLVSFGGALGEPVAVDLVLPEYTEDVERVRGYGYRTVHRAPSGTGVTDLAFEAAARALAEARLEPSNVDLLIVGLTDIAEYLYWDPAASLSHRLGLTDAEALTVTQACTAGITGLDIIAGKFATRPHYRNALLVAANRCCEAYWNRMDTQSMVFSDGAVATVARRDHPHLRWRAGESMTDGRYADFYRMDLGGAARPFTGDGSGQEAPHARDAWDIMDFFDFDDEQFEAFVQLMNSRARLIVERACARIGATVKDLRRLVFLHDNLRSLTSLADEFDLPLAATNVECGLNVGHLGAADQLYSLGEAWRGGDLHPGDLVALVGLGRGMHWACALIEA